LADAAGQTGSVNWGTGFSLDNRGEVRIQYLSSGEMLITAFPPFRAYKIDDPAFAAVVSEWMNAPVDRALQPESAIMVSNRI
jgi:hypothetical protein